MTSMILKESPDKISTPYDVDWNDDETFTFGIIGDVCFYVRTPTEKGKFSDNVYDTTHGNIIALVRRNDPQIQKDLIFISGDFQKLYNEILKKEKRKREHLETRLHFYDVSGRLFHEDKVVSFWNKRASVLPYLPYINKIIMKIDGENALSKYKFEFADKFGVFLPYYQINKPYESVSNAEEVRELLKKQHFDPNAKRRLAEIGMSRPKMIDQDAVARQKGYLNVAAMNNANIIGDSTRFDLTFQQILLENENTFYEFGCLMFDLDAYEEFTKFAKANIPEEKLTDSGYETETHVTVLYGLHSDFDTHEIKHYIEQHFTKPLTIKLGKVNKFDNDEYDVIKVEVFSEELKAFHDYLRETFPDKITNDYPDWKGHITLAYVTKGSCDKLVGNTRFDGIEISGTNFTLSKSGYENDLNRKEIIAFGQSE